MFSLSVERMATIVTITLFLMLFLLFPTSLFAAGATQAKLPTPTPQPTSTATRTSARTAMPTSTPTATSASENSSVAALDSSVTLSQTADLVSGTLVSETGTIESEKAPVFDWSSSENYLILGTDRRAGTSDWRTDTIMLVGFDRANERAAVFSIPRDLFVEIPGFGMGRINQIDYMGERSNGEGGGPALVSRVLSETLGVSAQHWVRVQMDGFVSFVDAVGGVTVTLDCPFAEPIFNLTTQSWDEFTLPAGDNLLDGEDAYWFVRLRLRESDIGRANRQRQFLWALRNKVLNTNLITHAPELWSAFNGTFSTDLNLFQIIEVASFSLRLQPQNVRASGLTLADLQNVVTEGGQQVLVIGNPTAVRTKLANVWAAPAMIDSNRREPATCRPLPDPSAPVTITGDTPIPENNASSSPTVPAQTETETPSSGDAIYSEVAIGNRVRLLRDVSLVVRSKPGANEGRELGTMAGGAEAVVLGGPSPEQSNGVTIVWWYVRTDGGAEGWIAGNSNERAHLRKIQ